MIFSKTKPATTQQYRNEDGWIDHPTGYMRIRHDDIMEVHCKDGAVETLPDAKLHLDVMEELAGDRLPLPFIMVFGGLLNCTPEARNFYTEGNQTARVVSRAALVINSLVSRVLGNLFIGISKPRFPVRLFTDKERALAWLKASSHDE